MVSATSVLPTRMEGSVRGDPNTPYQVEISADLRTWESLGGISTDATGNGTGSGTNPPAGNRHYHRARGTP